MNVLNLNLEYVKGEVDKALSTSPLIIRNYTKHLLKSQGKYLRAKSVLASAIREDGSIHYDAVKFAAAIELLHLATLVHDDVMDDADTRRGVITLHKKYGRKTAVICGDYVMAVATSLAASVEQKQEYLTFEMSNYMEAVALGELLQHINNGNKNLTIKEYLEIIDGKTAKLFEASMVAGITTTLAAKEVVDLYKVFGHNLGMIFQILDDVSDFEDTKELAKKPVQSDFEQGVITLPLIHAFKAFPEYLEKAKKDLINRFDIMKIVKESDSVANARELAEKYYSEALVALSDMKLQNDKHDVLLEILNHSMRR